MERNEVISVLLVEDDEVDRESVMRRIRAGRQKIHVDSVESLQEATECLKTTRYDVVLTDLCIRDSRGIETVSAIKAVCKDVPIIVLTGMDDDRIEREILSVGAQDYLVKTELSGNVVTRSIIHAVQRQELVNNANKLVSRLEESELRLKDQANQLLEKNERLKQLYKTAQDLVDNVSHDFRTPLTVIKDYVNIIGEGMVGEINPKQKTMLEKVSVRADDLNIMVDDLLDVSKLEAGLLGTWRRNTHVDEILRRIESMLQQRAATRGVLFQIDCPDDIPTTYCDPDKIARILTNLCVNAIKFCGEGGEAVLQIRYDEDARQIVFSVQDNGPGIAEESLQEIFERFRQNTAQLKSPIKGFGLGLNICQQLCRLNFSELTVRSEIGRGSTFSFSTPIAEPQEVLRRWLDFQGSNSSELHCISIRVDAETSEHSVDDFDNFLTCLLRGNDLLIRNGDTAWGLLMFCKEEHLDDWFSRAQAEFRKANRNRPLGLLPDFHAEVGRVWGTNSSPEEIVQDFGNLGSVQPVVTHV